MTMRLERRLTRLEADHAPNARLIHGWTALVECVGPGLGIAPDAVPGWAVWLAERGEDPTLAAFFGAVHELASEAGEP